ncbi:peptidase inhibitor family I36 protein [Streptomyces inhibens]|uniref:peptidase inhibitor family I36 protein n=1 Tax=Streptomyces inhibens TaxID=2293571 RepID=UPI0036BF1823
MRKSARLYRLAASAAAMLGVIAGLATATPAQASADQCPQGKVCVWSEANYGGQFKVVQGQLGQCFGLNAAWPDGTSSRIGSLMNKHRFQVEAFDNGSCSGKPYAEVKPGQSAATVSDRAQSIRVAPVCDQGLLCLYENGDYSGKGWTFAPNWSGVCYGAKSSDNVVGHAIYNRTSASLSTFTNNGLCTTNIGNIAVDEFRGNMPEIGGFMLH